MVWFSTTLEQNSGFKPERNKDLTCFDNYRDRLIENKYCDNFFGHIAQP